MCTTNAGLSITIEFIDRRLFITRLQKSTHCMFYAWFVEMSIGIIYFVWCRMQINTYKYINFSQKLHVSQTPCSDTAM